MKFQKLYSILVEMPMRIGDVSADDDQNSATLNVDISHFKDAERETFTISNGYELLAISDKINRYVHCYFLHNNKIVSYFQGEERKDGGVVTHYTESKKKYIINDSLLSEIYIHYLLRHYRFIQSDEYLTRHGFNFWVRNVEKFRKNGYNVNIYQYSYTNSGRFEYIETAHQGDTLSKYYNSDEDGHTYIFRIEPI
jgi:hypothetical protein